jgi:exopolysaccharide production protein ExoQ
MTWAARLRAPYAAVALFTVLAGDVWRYTLGWIGWGVVLLAMLGGGIWLAVAHRVELRRAPLPLVAFVGLAAVSVVWSAYPGATALGIVLLATATFGGLLLTGLLEPDELVDVLSRVLRLVLAASLAFELFVSLVVRRPVFPLWTDYPDDVPKAFMWSRDLLFEGGRIQGVVGNSNLLAMLALLALVVLGVQLAARRLPPVAGAAWLAVALACFLLTRSSTVILAAVGVAAALALLLLARRLGRRGRIGLGIATAVGALGAAAGAIALRGPLLALLGRSDDLTGRLDIWAAVGGLIAERPVLGWGWVGYWAPWVEPFDGLAVRGGVEYLQAHSAWLDVQLQLGVPGTIAFLAVVGLTAWRAVRLAVSDRGAVSLLPALLLAALLVQSLAESRLLIEGGWLLLVAIAVVVRPGATRLGARAVVARAVGP